MEGYPDTPNDMTIYKQVITAKCPSCLDTRTFTTNNMNVNDKVVVPCQECDRKHLIVIKVKEL